MAGEISRSAERGEGAITQDEADIMLGAAACGYAGLLSEEEMQAVTPLIQRGLMARCFQGAGGLMGLSKLVITDAGRRALSAQDQDPAPSGSGKA